MPICVAVQAPMMSGGKRIVLAVLVASAVVSLAAARTLSAAAGEADEAEGARCSACRQLRSTHAECPPYDFDLECSRCRPTGMEVLDAKSPALFDD